MKEYDHDFLQNPFFSHTRSLPKSEIQAWLWCQLSLFYRHFLVGIKKVFSLIYCICNRWWQDTSRHGFAKSVGNHCSRVCMLDNRPWRPVSSSPHIKNCVYVVSWPPSVNSEVHPAAPCMPPPSTFLHSTVGKKQTIQPAFGSLCAVDTVGVQSGGAEWDADVLLSWATITLRWSDVLLTGREAQRL